MAVSLPWICIHSIGCISSETLRLSAAYQILRPCIALSAGRAKGSAETPFVVDRKIGRPPRALHAAGAARIGQPAPHLVECCLGILFAKRGIGRVSRAQYGDQKHRQDKCTRQPQPVRHVVFSPAEVILRIKASIGPAAAHMPSESRYSWL